MGSPKGSWTIFLGSSLDIIMLADILCNSGILLCRTTVGTLFNHEKETCVLACYSCTCISGVFFFLSQCYFIILVIFMYIHEILNISLFLRCSE